MTERPRRLPAIVRLGAELLVVIAGVLIALSADAWMQDRQDRRDETRHLRSLREDFSISLALLEEARVQRAALTGALVDLLEVDLRAVPADSVGRWIYRGLFDIGSQKPRMAALEDLEASGELGLLTPELRDGIAELNRRLELFEAIEADFTESQQGLMDRWLVASLPLAPILAVSDGLPISERLTAREDWSALRTREARSLMAFKISLQRISDGRREDVVEQLDALLTLIDARLAELDREG